MGTQVLIHEARTGAALTENVLARWRVCTPKKERPPDRGAPGRTPSADTSSNCEPIAVSQCSQLSGDLFHALQAFPSQSDIPCVSVQGSTTSGLVF